MKLFIEKNIKQFYFLVFVMLLLVLFVFYFNTEKVKASAGLVEHTEQVIRVNNNVFLDIVTLETSSRGFLLTSNTVFKDAFDMASANMYKDLEELAKLCIDNTSQQARIGVLKKNADERLSITKAVILSRSALNVIDADQKSMILRGRLLTDSIKGVVNEINDNEFALLKLRKNASINNAENLKMLFLILLLLVIIILFLLQIIINNQKKRNRELENSTAAQKLLSQYSLSLIEASHDPLVTINIEGKITDTNEATVNITGIDRETLVGSDFFDYFTEPQKAREVYQEVFAKGAVADSPLTLQHKDGKLTDVLFNGSEYKNDAGNVMGVVIVARDVTAQKLAYQYARSLIEASNDPMFTISPAGKITDLNAASITVTGLSKEQLIDTDFFLYFTEPEKANACYKQIFANGFITDYPLTIIDGELTDVLFNGSVYKDGRGLIIGAVLVARDVTQLKKNEKDLVEAKVFAELATLIAEEAKIKAESATVLAVEAVKAKQQFLSNMSHEIRTPMNAIIGFTKVVLKTELTAKQKEYLTAIKMSGDALIVLINDILDLAKVDAGKMVYEKIPFKMSMSVAAMIHVFETKIQEKNLQLVRDYDNNIPEVLLGDPVRLHQIILNLLSNAVKFTSAGKITISVKLIREDDDTVNIEFSITDTGVGINENKLNSIFENFQQASSSTSRLYGGTGLGLAIVKQLVQTQGGNIEVVSKPDEGSTFSFRLDFQKTTEKPEFETGVELPATQMKNVKILVVEDIALNQLLMKTLLDEFGFESDIAANGKIAVEKLETNNYDLILMDLQMPEMNGFEATDYIRNILNLSLPIIALTADVTTVDLEKCKSVGMNDYISKPVDERLLLIKILGLIRKPETMDNIRTGNTGKENLNSMKCIDLTYLSKRTKANPVLMMEMISLYLEQTPALINSMKQSFHEQDWKLLHAAVHKIIPSFSIVGISNDFELMAKKIQDFSINQQQTEMISELVMQIEAVCLQACKELEIEFTRIKNNDK